MKKITATLGSSHNEFDRQLKDLLNEMGEVVNEILTEQRVMRSVANLSLLDQASNKLQTHLCNLCRRKADIVTVDLNSNTSQSFCNSCLVKT